MSSSDINVFGGNNQSTGPPVIAKFHNSNLVAKERSEGNNNTRFAAVGFADGRIAIMDIETGIFVFAVSLETTALLDHTILDFCWLFVPNYTPLDRSDTNFVNSLR